MIDLHNHILPGIDDGSDSIETSRKMAQAFVNAGVDRLAVTPHIRPGMFDNTEDGIRAVFAHMQRDLAEQRIELEIRPGVEYYWHEDLMAKFETPERLLTLADRGRHVLVEFSHSLRPVHLRETFFNLQLRGVTMVMAHPERYGWISDDLDYAEELVSSGMLMQGTLGPLAGLWGTRPRKALKQLLDRGLIHLISSDAHVVKQIPNYYGASLARLIEWVGKARAQMLLHDNPEKIYLGEPLSG
jgi:protein-tyrosine phosphatase